jgi:hypothetical protein
MNRWLQRLAELDGDGALARAQDSVQFVQYVQNSRHSQQIGQIEQIEQIEQPPGTPASPPPPTETAQANNRSVRPAEVGCSAANVAASPVPANFFDHRCAVCGQLARFGYGVRLMHGEEGRWFCAAHRPEAGRA